MSDPVVEKLLEKGAQAAWDSDSPMASWDQVPPKLQAGYRSQVGAAFDAVFPGWREGITREWGVRKPANPGVVYDFGDQSSAVADAQGAADQTVEAVSRWVGPWVPVEEGTDG